MGARFVSHLHYWSAWARLVLLTVPAGPLYPPPPHPTHLRPFPPCRLGGGGVAGSSGEGWQRQGVGGGFLTWVCPIIVVKEAKVIIIQLDQPNSCYFIMY